MNASASSSRLRLPLLPSCPPKTSLRGARRRQREGAATTRTGAPVARAGRDGQEIPAWLSDKLLKGSVAALAILVGFESGLEHDLGSLAQSGGYASSSSLIREIARSSEASALSSSSLAAEEDAVVSIFQTNTKSVVNVTNLVQGRTGGFDFAEIPVGTGSGFVWDRAGHVITNFHVIKGASALKVTLIDKRSYDADVVGFDTDKDVAILKLKEAEGSEPPLVPIKVGKSDKILVGQTVFAIGNPFGLDHTMTSGIVSGVGRVIQSQSGKPIRGAIQTDAAINPGNSGGPLLNKNGELIGINTAILSPDGKGANVGVGFAIPVDTVKGIVEQIIAFGKIVRPFLGITLAPDSVLTQLGKRGVLVLDVPAGSPASGKLRPTLRTFSGIQFGDIITEVNGLEIETSADLFNALDDLKVGDYVTLRIERSEGAAEEISVRLGERVTTFES